MRWTERSLRLFRRSSGKRRVETFPRVHSYSSADWRGGEGELGRWVGGEGRRGGGYLFPDTYYFPRHTKPEEILKTMVGRFRQVFPAGLQARAAGLTMTEREVVILASIIEKETGQDD